MKIRPASVSILTAALCVVALSLSAQDDKKKKPTNWEEKKAARFKPITDEQKASIAAAIPKKATAKPQKARRALVFYRCETFIHTSIPMGNLALEKLGGGTDAFAMDLADTYDVFNAKNLAKYDAVIFNNTTSLVFENDEQRKALMDFLAAGKGVVGIHAAGDNFYKWPEGAAMIGGQFNGHPWTAGGKWAFQLDDAKHPLNGAFGGKGFWHTDEIYQYKPESYAGPEKLRILVSLDMSKDAVSKIIKGDKGEKANKSYGGSSDRQVPVSWLQEFGGGRVFFTNLGHREDTYWNPAVLQHYLDGIQYALGDLEADATPTAKAGDLMVAPAPAAAE